MFETAWSTRRSTRARPAATSSTARCRSSMRPCSETAKSIRSALRPPPSRTSCWERTRRSRIVATIATAIASSAAAAAPIAIQAAGELETLTRLGEREDGRVVGGVVRGVLLVLHRRHLDVDRDPGRELHGTDVLEDDLHHLVRVDLRDVELLHDRLRA